VRWTPLRESRPVKGQDRTIWREQAKVFTRRQASDQPTGVIRLKTYFSVVTRGKRFLVTNVPARDPKNFPGVQGPPKLSVKIKTWNVETPFLRPVQCRAGITVRRAVGVAGVRGWKKQIPPGKPVDRA